MKKIQAIYIGVQKALDADFNESNHKRDKNGRFTSSGGASSYSSSNKKDASHEDVVASMSKDGRKIYNGNKKKIYEIASGSQLPSYIQKSDVVAAKSILSILGKVQHGMIDPIEGLEDASKKIHGKSKVVYSALQNMKECYSGALKNYK